MKVIFEPEDKKYAFIIIAVLIFIGLNIFQYSNNSDLSASIAEKKRINAEQERAILSLEASAAEFKKVKEELVIKADSFQVSEEHYKYKYYATDKKLKSVLSTYSMSDDDAKWDAFTDALKE